MDNTVVNALAPLLTGIVTAGVQILIEFIKDRKLRKMKWWRTMIITAAAATLAIILIFSKVTDSTRCAITSINWSPYANDGLGSTIAVKPVLEPNCAIEVSFDLKKSGWVAVYKKLGPELMAWWIDGIEFSYSGMGNPNTIEVKLLDTQNTPYEAVMQNSTDTGGRISSISIPYGALIGPGGKIFKRGGFDLDRIDFSFSNGPEDITGPGNVVFNDIRIMLSWKIWLVIYSPILGIGIIVAYCLWQKRNKKTKKHRRKLTTEKTPKAGSGSPLREAIRRLGHYDRNETKIRRVSRYRR